MTESAERKYHRCKECGTVLEWPATQKMGHCWPCKAKTMSEAEVVKNFKWWAYVSGWSDGKILQFLRDEFNHFQKVEELVAELDEMDRQDPGPYGLTFAAALRLKSTLGEIMPDKNFLEYMEREGAHFYYLTAIGKQEPEPPEVPLTEEEEREFRERIEGEARAKGKTMPEGWYKGSLLE